MRRGRRKKVATAAPHKVEESEVEPNLAAASNAVLEPAKGQKPDAAMEAAAEVSAEQNPAAAMEAAPEMPARQNPAAASDVVAQTPAGQNPGQNFAAALGAKPVEWTYLGEEMGVGENMSVSCSIGDSVRHADDPQAREYQLVSYVEDGYFFIKEHGKEKIKVTPGHYHPYSLMSMSPTPTPVSAALASGVKPGAPTDKGSPSAEFTDSDFEMDLDMDPGMDLERGQSDQSPDAALKAASRQHPITAAALEAADEVLAEHKKSAAALEAAAGTPDERIPTFPQSATPPSVSVNAIYADMWKQQQKHLKRAKDKASKHADYAKAERDAARRRLSCIKVDPDVDPEFLRDKSARYELVEAEYKEAVEKRREASKALAHVNRRLSALKRVTSALSFAKKRFDDVVSSNVIPKETLDSLARKIMFA